MTTKTTSRTARYLAEAIRRSGKTQVEIARDAGLTKPNVLSMMKLGQTKVPLGRIPAIAKACGADALYFTRLALEEYHPELFEMLMDTLGESLTEAEWAVIKCYRTGTRGKDLDVDTEVRLRLIGLFGDIRDRQAKGKWPMRQHREPGNP